MYNIKYAIEAVLFSSGEPVKASKIAKALDITPSAVRENIRLLRYEYESQGRGITVCEADDAFCLCSNPEYHNSVKAIIGEKRRQPLSNAAMEVLAAVAYKQPVTRGQIEEIRGVNSDGALNRLIEKGLVEEAGRLDAPGKPILYKTTGVFLRSFGLGSTDELPDCYRHELDGQTEFDIEESKEEMKKDKDDVEEIIGSGNTENSEE
ncbi:MAG: SMC-Scp complex subunit ScpB [Oscillospiraceae bacterium]|nr:SMC-Scp complex subunit ScpB [Oscillospiraceae bacterium]